MSFKIIYNGEEGVFNGQFSLLDALEENGLDPDYSCRSGACEACKCRLNSGKVEWIQTPSVDLAKNEILSCSCVPISDIDITQLD